MTLQDLSDKYGMNEAELYVYAFNHLRGFKKREAKEKKRKFSEAALRQLDWILANEGRQEDEIKEEIEEMPQKENDDWLHDPTEDEPDDNEIEPPMVEPAPEKSEQKTSERIEDADDEKQHAIAQNQQAWAEEKSEMSARLKAMQQELNALRHTHLTVQSDAAEKQAELLAKAIHEKQIAESKIAMIKNDAASVKHLSNVRIKELEERNETLEQKLKDMHAEMTTATEEMQKLRQSLQKVTAAADEKCSKQWLQLHEADRKQDELFKAIHEKEIALTEEKEKTQNLLEKYNSTLLRIGEIVTKIEKARSKMREISAEFDEYVNANETAEAGEIGEAARPDAAVLDESKPEQIAPAAPIQSQAPVLAQAPNPDTIEVLGKPLHEIYPEQIPQEQATPRSSLWRKIASFF